MTVRTATLADLPWLHEQCRAFNASYPSQVPLYADPAVVEAHLRACIESDEHLALISETRTEDCGCRKSTGFLVGQQLDHPYNPDLCMMTVLLWWVVPEHRGSLAAGRLLDAFVKQARKRADWITVGLGPTTRIGSRALAKRGFRPIEQTYLLEVA